MPTRELPRKLAMHRLDVIRLVTLPVLALVFSFQAMAAEAEEALSSPDRYNVVWDSPSQDWDGSMPLGNGDIALNAWVEPTGDIRFYIAKTDAWGDNGRLLKIGRLRVTLDPAPKLEKGYRQTLRLRDATMEVVYGEEPAVTRLQLWVDANCPVIHLSVDSPTPLRATARIELWRTTREELKELEVSDVMLDRSKPDGRHAPVFVEPDTVIDDLEGGIGWYHFNVKSVGPAVTAQVQGVADFPRPDPLLHRAFGAVVTTGGGQRMDSRTLARPMARSHHFQVFVLTRHPTSPQLWLQEMKRLIAETDAVPFALLRAAHEQWWHRFWRRSWIDISSNRDAVDLSPVPANNHPVRVGVDQTGQNRFRGQLGRLSLLNVAVDAEKIREWATASRDRPVDASPQLLGTGQFAIGTQLPDSQSWQFSPGLTIAGWVHPDLMPGGGGRIVDKVTPGGADGFLLDTFPGNSLRLIVGRTVLTVDQGLPPGKWSHVAAVVDNRKDTIELFLNGESVARHVGSGLDDAQYVSQMYALQRFIDACAGRGQYPIKFNGSLFTVPYPDRPGDADYRRWGPGYWWQNTRLPYMSMCTSGDFEMLRPLFRMYAEQLMPLQKYRTRLYLNHDGAFIPECIYFWGDVFSETYGWTPFEQRTDKLQQSGYHKWEWVSGPELVWMMLDYYEHTHDVAFLQQLLLPTAHEVLTFFDQQYPIGDDGKLVMHPSQALETWWDTTNPMPELAGLHAVTGRLRHLPAEVTTAQQRAFWSGFAAKLPPLPTREIDGKRALAPADRYAQKRNIENPELYAVFPFRLVAFEKPDADLGRVALEHRADRGNQGWRQDDVFMAYLGLSDEARAYVVSRARKHDERSRFPAFWGPNYDWVPDQDHGAILMKALQAMLIQTDQQKIFLLPAWPRDWDVRFQVHAPLRTVIQGEFRDGKLAHLQVTPKERTADIVDCSVTHK